jgi:hypothetical protein
VKNSIVYKISVFKISLSDGGLHSDKPPFFLECTNDTLYLQNRFLNVKGLFAYVSSIWLPLSQWCLLNDDLSMKLFGISLKKEKNLWSKQAV